MRMGNVCAFERNGTKNGENRTGRFDRLLCHGVNWHIDFRGALFFMTFEFSEKFPLYDQPRPAARSAVRVWFADKSALRSMIARLLQNDGQHTLEIFAP
jgi:hypothetical protein